MQDIPLWTSRVKVVLEEELMESHNVSRQQFKGSEVQRL